jgi:hypothetical protein
MKIYVVFGSTGEYSDRTEWPVKAFYDEDKAKELVENASEEADRIFANRENKYSRRNDESNKFDPDMRMDYTNTSYYFIAVELEE